MLYKNNNRGRGSRGRSTSRSSGVGSGSGSIGNGSVPTRRYPSSNGINDPDNRTLSFRGIALASPGQDYIPLGSSTPNSSQPDYYSDVFGVDVLEDRPWVPSSSKEGSPSQSELENANDVWIENRFQTESALVYKGKPGFVSKEMQHWLSNVDSRPLLNQDPLHTHYLRETIHEGLHKEKSTGIRFDRRIPELLGVEMSQLGSDTLRHDIEREALDYPPKIDEDCQSNLDVTDNAPYYKTQILCMFNIGTTSVAEFWDYLRHRLTPALLEHVLKVKAISQPNGRRRIDFWVTREAATAFTKALGMTARIRRNGASRDNLYPIRKMSEPWNPNLPSKSWKKATRHWRLDYWRPFKGRAPLESEPFNVSDIKKFWKDTIITWNVNGVWGKREELEILLSTKRVAVCAVQETMTTECRPFSAPGYKTYQRSRKKGFRGHVLVIDEKLHAYEILKDKVDFLIHVKVSGLVEGAPVHVMAVYMPSGGGKKAQRTKNWTELRKRVNQILADDPKARIIGLGDWNEDEKKLKGRLQGKRNQCGLRIHKVKGSNLTFFRKGTKPSALDHLAVSEAAELLLNRGTVLRHWRESCHVPSDHAPLSVRLRKPAQRTMGDEHRELNHYSFKPHLVKEHQRDIVFSNRWEALPTEECNSLDELNDAAQHFSSTLLATAVDVGAAKKKTNRLYLLNRAQIKVVKKLQKKRAKWRKAIKSKAGNVKTLEEEYKAVRKEKKIVFSKVQTNKRRREVWNACALWYKNDMRDFWKWEAEVANETRSVPTVSPIRSKDRRVLFTSKADILSRTTEYYKELAQDDPMRLSQNEAYWQEKCKRKRRPEAFEVNYPPKWTEVMTELRNMKPGGAAGNDEITSDPYKALLREECNEKVRKEKGCEDLGELIDIPLPTEQFSDSPLTPMGKALSRVIEGIWKLKAQPEAWNSSVYTSLYKSGDPELMENYRGISLIVIGMKVVTAILATRISKCMNIPGGTVREQAGFRPGEEAVAQFIALAESVRRRRLKKLKTYGIFIDFQKAFDKVMHEALFAKLDNEGFRGEFLEVIKGIYRTSKACCRVAGNYGEMFDLLRGTRQGCPLSPILFLIFINDIFEYLPAGVTIPGMGSEDKNPGLLYADDLLGLAETESEVSEILKGVNKWSEEWWMPVGAPKCAVMVWSDDPADSESLKSMTLEIGDKRIEVAEQYKYLGIYVSPKLGDKDGSDEEAHAKRLATNILKVTHKKKAFLRNPKYPFTLRLAVWKTKIMSVGCYGAEWIGMSQKRTDIVQKAANVGLRLLIQSSSKSTWNGITALCMEMGIPTIEEKFSDLRIRLWLKAKYSKTWIGELVNPEHWPKGLGSFRTWVTGCSSRYNTLTNTSSWEGKKVRWEYIRDCEAELLRRNGKIIVWEGHADTHDTPERDLARRQHAALLIRTRRVCKEVEVVYKDNKVVGTPMTQTIDYVNFGFNQTRDYIKMAVLRPELTEGSTWLLRLRTGNWWSTRTRREMLEERHRTQIREAKKKGDKPKPFTNPLRDDLCPVCGGTMGQNGDPEWVHILLDCEEWNRERTLFLSKHIAFLKKAVRTEGVLEGNRGGLEVAIRLLGGVMARSRPLFGAEAPELRAPTDLGEGEARSLDSWSLRWGGETELFIAGSLTLGMPSEQGWVAVAKFLQGIMPRHVAALKGPATPIEKGYGSEGFESPEKAPRNNLKLSKGLLGLDEFNESDDEYDSQALEEWADSSQSRHLGGNDARILDRTALMASYVKALSKTAHGADSARRSHDLRVDEPGVWWELTAPRLVF